MFSMLKINLERGRRWVEALRSGKYPQGRASLNNEGKLCCLGVVCELAVPDGVVERYELEGYPVTYDGSDIYLPASVSQWLGLPPSTARPAVPYEEWMGDYAVPGNRWGGGGVPLDVLNDKGVPFDLIADVIERHLLPAGEQIPTGG